MPLLLLLWRWLFEALEALEERLCVFEAAAAAAVVVAPSQSKGLANGLTAVRVELAAAALNGGLNMVAAAAAAAE